jgi:hypothetical protein
MSRSGPWWISPLSIGNFADVSAEGGPLRQYLRRGHQVHRPLHDQASQRIRNLHIVTRAGRSVTYPVEIRYAWPAELDLMAQLAGLQPLGRWGGWLGQPFTSGSSSHVSAWTAPG